MSNSMWNFILNYLTKNRGGKMENRKTIVFTVITSIAYIDENAWQKDVRQIRRILKETIGSCPNMKVLKIDSKEG